MQRARITRILLPSLFFALTALAGTQALAGEIKIGQDEALDTSDNGALTAESRKAAVAELDNVPGEDMWVAYVWAKLDRPAPGPLYVEFWQEVNGQEHIVKRHEYSEFDGEKFYSGEVELEGNMGFNKNRTYTIKVVQVNAKGKDIVLAKGKIKLVKTGRKPAEDPNADKGGEEDLTEQDKLDSFAGGEEEKGDAPGEGQAEQGGEEGPPPVEPKKKGCTVAVDGAGWSGPAVLFLAGLGLMIRRRRR